MNRLRDSISELRRDFVHGSSWYFERIANILLTVDEEELRVLRKKLPSIRPGMASISTIDELLMSDRIKSSRDASEMGKRLVEYLKSSAENIEKQAEKIRIDSVATMSYSEGVRFFMRSAKVSHVFLLQSKPGNEWKNALEDYSSFCDVDVFPDTAMCSIMKDVDSVVIGFDGLFASGYFTNKIGTYSLCLCAREYDKKVIAAGQSFKTSLTPIMNVMDKRVRGPGRSKKIPLFDVVPLSLVNVLVTDLDTFTRPSGQTVKILHEKFLKKIQSSF